MPSKLLLTAAIAATAATAATAQYTFGVCPDYVPAFNGMINTVGSNDTNWWLISPTNSVTAPGCSVSGYVSQYNVSQYNAECLSVSNASLWVQTISDGCSYLFVGHDPETITTVNILCEEDYDWLDIPGDATFDGTVTTIYGFYAGVCPPTAPPTQAPPTQAPPTQAPVPTAAPSDFSPSLDFADYGYVWIIIFVSLGVVVLSVIGALVIIVLRRRRIGYAAFTGEAKMVFPFSGASLTAEQPIV